MKVADPLVRTIIRKGSIGGRSIDPAPSPDQVRRARRNQGKPAPAPRDPDGWKILASCLGLPSEWWVLDKDPEPTIDVLTICRGCPVKGACLRTALSLENFLDVAGIMGGTMASDRRAVRSLF